ncbi:MAG: CDP-alcohol phosphatidyltransferase family protein [Acutalibacteraceae bacterium]
MLEFEKKTDKIFTIPNIISFVRILIIIPFIISFVGRHYYVAAIMIALSGLSDMFDGMIARKFNQITELGKILDPIADKLTLLAVILCIGTLVPKIVPLVAVLVLKDVLMLSGGAYLIKRNIKPPAAKWYGKLATVVFYISMATIVALEIATGSASDFAVLTTVIMLITTAVMVFALIKYAIIFFALLKEQKNNNEG